ERCKNSAIKDGKLFIIQKFRQSGGTDEIGRGRITATAESVSLKNTEILQSIFVREACCLAQDLRVEIESVKRYFAQIGPPLACNRCSFHQVTRNSTGDAQYG